MEKTTPPPLPHDISDGSPGTSDILVCNPPSSDTTSSRNEGLMKFPTKLNLSIDNADNESVTIVTSFLEYANNRGGYNGCWAFGKKISFMKKVLEHEFQYDGIFAK